MTPLIALAGVGGLWALLERYRKTNHGPNHWTLEALLNVALHALHFERAAALIEGDITSVFRSLEVNTKIKGSKTSRHMKGLAVDIKPRKLSPTAARDALLAAALRGELGRVRSVILEPTIVHVDWYAPDEPGAPVKTGKWGFDAA